MPHGPFDLAFQATGASAVVFESMRALAKNGVLVSWLEQLLTHPVAGLENYAQLLETLSTAKGAIKVY